LTENKEKKIFYQPGDCTSTEIYELCTKPKSVFTMFLVYRFGTDKLSVEASLNYDADPVNGYEAFEIKPMRKAFWPLASITPELEMALPKIEPNEVFNEVRKFIYDSVELPNEIFYDIAVLWILSSYLIEKFDAVSYLAFIGPKDSGKTRALEVITQLAYRGLLSPSCSPAGIFRLIQMYQPTLCLDEAEIYGNEQKTEAIAVLNAGYKKGQLVLRYDKDKKQMEGFSVFGHKALASTDVFVRTLESRSIIINMRRNSRFLPVFLDKERSAHLRLVLLLYRFNVLANKAKILEDRETILSYLPIRNGRIAELFYLLIAVAPSVDVRKKIGEYVKELSHKRQEEDTTTIAALLIEAALLCKDKVVHGKLAIKEITNIYNLAKDESYTLNSRTIGRELKKLGFEQTRIAGGAHAIYFDEKLVNDLSKRYLSRELSQTSLTSPSQIKNKNDISANNDNSDLSREERIRLDDISIAAPREENTEEKICNICFNKNKSNWMAISNNGLVVDICQDCGNEFIMRKQNANAKAHTNDS
jgi:hypothetical protein